MLAACFSPERFLLALILVVLPGCMSSPKQPDEPIVIVWNRVEEPHKLCEQLSGRPEFFKILGCSKWSDARRTCAIYAPMPRDERDTQRMATLGHELMHCFDGNWHDRYGRMNDHERQQAAAGASRGPETRKSGSEPDLPMARE